MYNPLIVVDVTFLVPPEAQGNQLEMVVAYDLETYSWIPEKNVTLYCADGPSRVNTMKIVKDNLGVKRLAVGGRVSPIYNDLIY